ncbi:MAG: hypothetical protein Q4Q04_01330, partial [Methanocorpusculum sp.]|nr:hypothetical protein [Methanocorpusculum sp.]
SCLFFPSLSLSSILFPPPLTPVFGSCYSLPPDLSPGLSDTPAPCPPAVLRQALASGMLAPELALGGRLMPPVYPFDTINHPCVHA